MDIDDAIMPPELPEGVVYANGYVRDKRLGLAPKVKIYLRRHPEHEVYEWRPIEMKISENVVVELAGHELFDAVWELMVGTPRCQHASQLTDMPKEK